MKNFFVLALILFFSSTGFSQTWISSNAVWHYNYEALGGVKGFHKIEYLKDTVMLGVTCQYLQVTDQQYYPAGPPNWGYMIGTPEILPPRFTFIRNDTVFYFNQDKFSVLYCMNAQAGDSWDLGVDTSVWSCSESIVHVDDTWTTTINGQNWPTLFVYPDPDASVWLYGRIVGRLGSFDNYLFPQDQNCDSTIAVDFAVFYFSCFKDDDFPLINIYDCDCDNPLALGLGEYANTTRSFSIYPNPAVSSVSLDIVPFDKQAAYRVRINNLYGQQLSEIICRDSGTDIDIGFFPTGIYMVSLYKEGIFMGCQKLIVD